MFERLSQPTTGLIFPKRTLEQIKVDRLGALCLDWLWKHDARWAQVLRTAQTPIESAKYSPGPQQRAKSSRITVITFGDIDTLPALPLSYEAARRKDKTSAPTATWSYVLANVHLVSPCHTFRQCSSTLRGCVAWASWHACCSSIAEWVQTGRSLSHSLALLASSPGAGPVLEPHGVRSIVHKARSLPIFSGTCSVAGRRARRLRRPAC